jgi:drug/metabolite transporter superfamily protein YnfA
LAADGPWWHRPDQRCIAVMQEEACMKTLRVWILLSWTVLPLAMFGGALLLRRLSLGDATPFQATWLRAGHAHGGVLIVMSLLYYLFLDQTSLSASAKRAASAVLFAGIGALVGGFFLHAVVGQPNQASIGTAVTVSGAVLMAIALIALVYGLIRTR